MQLRARLEAPGCCHSEACSATLAKRDQSPVCAPLQRCNSFSLARVGLSTKSQPQSPPQLPLSNIMSLTTALCSPTVPLQRHARLAAGSPAAQQPLAGPWQRQRRQERRSAPCAATASLAVLADFTAGPAAASEAFIDTTAGIPDVGQSPEAARVAAEAAADAAANDPANIVFTVLFASE